MRMLIETIIHLLNLCHERNFNEIALVSSLQFCLAIEERQVNFAKRRGQRPPARPTVSALPSPFSEIYLTFFDCQAKLQRTYKR
jgi:hypothetical protein